MKKIASLGLSLLLTIAAQAETYKFAATEWAGLAGVHVADAKGFWKQLGVNVEVVDFGDDTEASQNSFNKGHTDFACDMLGTWVGRHLGGTKVKFIAELNWSNGGDKFILAAGEKVEGLKGKKIGVYDDGPAVKFFANQVLAKAGLSLSDVTLVAVEDPNALTENFITKRLSAIINYDPEAARAAKAGGSVVATTATYPGCMPEGVAVLAERYAKMPKEDVVKILQGLVMAQDWIADPANEKELYVILKSKTFAASKITDDAEIRDMMSAVKLHGKASLAEIHKAGGAFEKFTTELQVFLAKTGEWPAGVAMSDIVDISAMQEATNK